MTAPAVEEPEAPLAPRVHSWDLASGVDGPGTRLVLFLAGCPLRCLYCQNPDTWTLPGRPTPLRDIEDLIRRYRPFLKLAGGGVTVSGGEPLQQPDATAAIFAAARHAGLHTALDTSGFLGRRAGDDLLDLTDLVLLDVKAGSEAAHRRLTMRPLAPTLELAERLARRGDRVWLRYVLVPGHNDAPAEVGAVAVLAARLGNVERVDVLPFHKLGAEKYTALGLRFPLAAVDTPDVAAVERARAAFAEHGLVAV